MPTYWTDKTGNCIDIDDMSIEELRTILKDIVNNLLSTDDYYDEFDDYIFNNSNNDCDASENDLY